MYNIFATCFGKMYLKKKQRGKTYETTYQD